METLTIGDHKVEISVMEHTDMFDPRDDENVGTMICFHRRYRLGDKTELNSNDFDSWVELKNHIEKNFNPVVILPLYLYDHSGITISTKRFSCPWDSGQIGFVFATRQKVLETFGCKRCSKVTKQKVTELLVGEVSRYDDYIQGNIYEYRILKGDEIIDSCCGFFGHDHEESGLMEYVRSQIAS